MKTHWALLGGLLTIFGAIVPARSEISDSDLAPSQAFSPQLEAIDVPTSDVLDKRTLSTAFRFYSEGGIVTRFLIAPIKRLNLGLGLDAQRLIGGGDPHLIRPSLFAKVRVYDGSDVIPSLAVGYDNQGYLYKDSIRDFSQLEKGLYLVGSHEIFLPDFELHLGINFPRLDESASPYGFAGITWKIVQRFGLMIEYDNIQRAPENRFNAGGRFWVSRAFNIDVAARNIGRRADHGSERIARLNYVIPF